MRIDAYTHFIPSTFFDKLVESGYPDIGKRMRGIPSIHDLDVRKKVVDQFDDYAQILSYPMPPLELLAKGAQIEEYAKAVNDGFVDICAKNNDHFPGWVAEAPIGAPDDFDGFRWSTIGPIGPSTARSTRPPRCSSSTSATATPRRWGARASRTGSSRCAWPASRGTT